MMPHKEVYPNVYLILNSTSFVPIKLLFLVWAMMGKARSVCLAAWKDPIVSPCKPSVMNKDAHMQGAVQGGAVTVLN